MSVEDIDCNVEMKQENLSSCEELKTYKRKRKRTVGSSSSDQHEVVKLEEVDEAEEDREVSHMTPAEGKGKDFGWEHGKIVNGNRYHWKCNWCNFVGRSGGVTRLKKHLAGGWHVKPCLKVPQDIAITMNKHLIESRKKRIMREEQQDDLKETNSGSYHLDIFVDEGHGQNGLGMQVHSEQSKEFYTGLKNRLHLNANTAKVSIASNKCKRTARRFRSAIQQSKAYRRSRTATKQFKNDVAKAIKESYDTILFTETNEQGVPSTIDGHWRTVLKNMLLSPGVHEGGGIQSSITDALLYGPHGQNSNSKMNGITMNTAEPKDRYKTHCEGQSQSLKFNNSANASVDGSDIETSDQTDTVANKLKCQAILFDLLCSDKFVSLCNLLCENFHSIKVDKLFDINWINLKMKNGVYGQSPGLFNQDLQQIWRRFQKVGEEIVLLTSGLLNVSQDTYQKQVGVDLVNEASTQKREVNDQLAVVSINSNNSDSATQLPFSESDPSTRPDQTEAIILHKLRMCKLCGTQADGEHSIICDQCESAYHFDCVNPPVEELPSRSWYCTSCTKDRMKSAEPPVNNPEQENIHDNCMVCERLEISGNDRIEMADGFREGSVSSLESDELPEPSRTALSHLCKQCGTCEDEDRRFLVCGHNQCPYKYYHVRCLKSSQMASFHQLGRDCWYCPSCLCRACFLDRDDDKIVLCDGCDEAYHTYCMNPPRATIPKGQWYCLQCNIEKAREGMRRYEQWVLQQHGEKDVRQVHEANRMDLLLCAVEKLSSEENLATGKK